MNIISGRKARATARFLPLVALGLLAIAGPPAPAQSTGGMPVFFGPDIRISGVPSDPAGTSHWETCIAANPKDAKNLVAGYFEHFPTINFDQTCSFSVTGDGGQSWTVRGAVPMRDLPGSSYCVDPSVAADGRGTFYYAYLDVNLTPTGGEDVDIRVARSTDKGQSFPTSTTAVHEGPYEYLDKPYLAADAQPKSRFRGTVYVSYTNFVLQVGIPTGIFVVVSRDGGGAWSAPIFLDGPAPDGAFPQGSVPVVAPDGTAYVFWARYVDGSEPMSIRFSKSRDGGRSWSPAANAASNLPGTGLFYLKNADSKFGANSDRGLNANSFPTAAIAANGTIFVAWTDFPQGSCKTAPQSAVYPTCTNADVRLSVSRDGGATWTAPVKVTDETNATDQFFPWMAAHPNGLVSLAWIDRRLDPDNINYDTFYTNTFDGASFLPNVRVSTATSLLGLAAGIGDYNGIAATTDAVFPVWGDLRNQTDVQAYVARGTLGP